MFGSLCRVTVYFIVWIENPKVMLEKYEKFMTGASSKSSLNLLHMKRNMWNVYTVHKWQFSGFCPQKPLGTIFEKRERGKYDGWSFVTYHYPCWRQQSECFAKTMFTLSVQQVERSRVQQVELSPHNWNFSTSTKMIAMFTIPGPTGWVFSTFSHCQECKPNISTKLWSSNLIFRNQKSRVKTLHLRLKIYPKSLISRLNLVFIPTHNKFPEPLSWKRWRWAQPLFSSSSGRSFPTQ